MQELVASIAKPEVQKPGIKESKTSKVLLSQEEKFTKDMNRSLNNVPDVLCLPIFAYETKSRKVTARKLATTLNEVKKPWDRKELQLAPYNRALINKANRIFPEVSHFDFKTTKVTFTPNQ